MFERDVDLALMLARGYLVGIECCTALIGKLEILDLLSLVISILVKLYTKVARAMTEKTYRKLGRGIDLVPTSKSTLCDVAEAFAGPQRDCII